jgi:alkylhydroperoxidase/carboxymuconolactone decarboxylase family protein YurZ
VEGTKVEVTPLDYREQLRRLTINEVGLDDITPAQTVQIATNSPGLDSRTLALLRIAGLVARGGAVPSFGAQADAALAAGATADDIVAVLFALISVLGLPCVVDAAPKVALALGYDIEQDL